MGVERLDPIEVSVRAVDALGLDSEALDLGSAEALAASMRRAAAFMCPTTPGALVRAVDEAITRLPSVTDESRSQLETTLNSLVAYGDLIELPVDDDGASRRRLFLGPPAFVRRASGVCLLIGLRPDGAALLGDELLDAIESDGHVRALRLEPDRIDEVMSINGLIELQPEQWLRAPRPLPPEEHLRQYESRLDAARASGYIEELRIIDPTSSVTYYRGRWRPTKPSDSGRYVARRPQAFGADLWCFSEVEHGESVRLIDLPVQSPLAPGADEAWRLQAALDVLAGRPQLFSVATTTRRQRSVLNLYSPIPSWAQRRLDIVGTPLPRSKGALFSYAVPTEEIDQEHGFLNQMMWLTAKPNERTSGEI